ncbi:MAG: sterol carrier protein domain-containing protein [Acidimicrobiia bacterium]|nr:sterol carrier protein domain-containing protein [Acidimicrobiia bacterium]
MEIRAYDPETDFAGVARMWREIGWLDAGEEKQEQGLKVFAEQFDSLVAVIDGSPECFVSTGTGSVRYLTEDLPLSVLTAVTTSHVARRQGLAKTLAARSIARDAVAGAAVSALGMFDQGYYNKLGFGTGTYEYWHALDPASLRVSVAARPPKRLGPDDWEAIHESRIARRRGHGSCVLDAGAATEAELLWASNGFGLGYADGPDGELTHLLWFSAKGMEFGPLNAWFMTYQTTEQFLELMSLLVQLGDNVQLVRMREPADIQLQDLIHQPFRRRRMTEKSEYENRVRANAYWQMRMCDVARCVAATSVPGGPVRFNLVVTDPIEAALDDGAEWRGVGGDYIVTFGPESSAEPGVEDGLPTLRAGVGAFTRLWLGVRPASGLAATDDLTGPGELLADLDRVLRLPTPKPDWDF